MACVAHLGRNRLAIQYIIARRFRDGGDFGDQLLFDAQLRQCLSQQFNYRIKVRVIQSLRDSWAVGGAHGAARVFIRTTKGHSQKSLLLGGLTRHIDIGEKTADALIAQDFVIENVNRGVHGGRTAEFIIQLRHGSSFLLRMREETEQTNSSNV